MSRLQWALVFAVLMIPAVLVGCGGRRLSEEATPMQASDTESVESPVNNAENP
jgi:predicted lipoprotein